MLQTALLGPYRLAVDEINHAVPRRSPGAFALGYLDPQGAFRISYVGRSDEDIGDRLRSLIGSDLMFKYSCFTSSKTAFEKECEMFHDFRPRGNRLHPERAAGSSWVCPRCHTRGFLGR